MRKAPVDWASRVDRVISRWNRLGKPDELREAVTAMTAAQNAWSEARNKLMAVVEELERKLSLEEHQ